MSTFESTVKTSLTSPVSCVEGALDIRNISTYINPIIYRLSIPMVYTNKIKRKNTLLSYVRFQQS